MEDKIVKALACNDSVRIYCVSTTNALNEIGNRLNYLPSALDAMGRLMSVTVMMGAMLELEETVTVKIEGDGPIGRMMADADAHGHVRAYCENPHCHFEYADERLNVKDTVGQSGFINVIKDLKLKEPFIGSTPIINGELAEDFAYYFMVSEQVPSAVSLGVLVDKDLSIKCAGGFIVQMMPGSDELLADVITYRLQEIPSITTMINEGKTIEEILEFVFEGMDLKILESSTPSYKCDCSRERVEKALISIGKDDLQELYDEGKGEEIVCNFCNKKYTFSKDDIGELLNRK